MTRRFWIALGLSAPLVIYGMAEMVLGHSALHFLSDARLALIQMALAAPVVLGAGWPLLQRAWRFDRSVAARTCSRSSGWVLGRPSGSA